MALAVAVLSHPAKAQIVPAVVTQFDMVGFIQQATLNTPGDLFSGGTITINDIKIIVPYNTVLQMPAFALTWQQVFAMAPPPYTGLQTGMALQDIPKPRYTYEVHVQGNRLPDGTHIAGLLFLSQQSLHQGQGWITSINPATGVMVIDGITRVKINDPLGRYGVGFPGGASPDARFTIDEDNPTVRAVSGYPMCVPRSANDALCPQKNRPANPLIPGALQGVFTMPAAAATPTPAGVPDPFLMAPFEVGDFVTYNGVLVDDAIGTYVLAHTVIAQLTILTAPGTQPAYTAMDVLLQGVVPKTGAPPGQEGAVRTRVEGFSTDAGGTTATNVYAVDVQPCTGVESERLWLDRLANPPTPFTIGIDTTVVLGRWRFRPTAKDEDFVPPSRNLRARNTSLTGVDHPVVITPNGLRAGEYTAPIFDYIFAEAAPAGNQPPPPNIFETFMFLAQGEGPFNGGPVLGQLSPWPNLVVPATPLGCAAAAAPPPPPPPAGGLPLLEAQGDLLSRTGPTVGFSAAQLLANDIGTGITMRGVSPVSAAGGAITGTGPWIYNAPTAAFTGTDSFVYEIGDAFGQTAIGVVTVVVNVAVPNVVGLSEASAVTAITAAGLTVGASTVANSPTVPFGNIISQAPVAATSVPSASAVALVVSLGPANVAVPSVINLTQAAASTAITGAGLTVGAVTTANSATVAAGSVISQSPTAGTSIVPGSAVAFVVSLGAVANVTVPNVFTITQAAASTAITGAGLTVGAITSASSATVATGSVISETPAAGTSVAPGTAVALVVSLGPANVAVPSVVNLTQAAASTAITGAGLTVGAITSANSAAVPAGSVISQTPAAGTSVAPGTAVALVVSLGPANVAVPSVVNLTQAAASTAITGAGLTVGAITSANSAAVPAGSVISETPAAGASVVPGSAVALVVSLGPAAVGPRVDNVVFSDGPGTRTTAAFSTAAANEQLVAFVASDGPPAVSSQALTISGAGLTWTLVQRAATRFGVAEIWTARAATVLTNVTVTSTQSAVADFHQSLTVVSFTGVSAIGASAAGGAATGAPTVSLVAQAAGSVVYGVGNDWDTATARTIPAGQTKVHEAVDTAVGDTFWVQAADAATATAGVTVTLNATAPTADQWNFAIVELRP